MSIHEYDIQNLACADCGNKIEAEIQALPEVHSANLDFINRKLTVQYHSAIDQPLKKLNSIAASIEPGVEFTSSGEQIAAKNNVFFWIRLGVAVLLMLASLFVPDVLARWFGIVAWLLAGYRVLIGAGRSLFPGSFFRSNC